MSLIDEHGDSVGRTLSPMVLAAGFFLAAACGDGGNGGPSDAADAEEAVGDATGDMGVDDASPPDADATPDVLPDGTDAPSDAAEDDAAMVEGVVTLPFDLTAEGRGSIRVEAVTVARSAGLVEVDGPLPVIVYERTRWPEFDYVLFHVLAPEADNLNVMYFYCGNRSADSFDYIWHESFDVYLEYEAASGSCTSTDDPVEAEVALHALAARPAPEDLVTGFSVNGADLSIGDGGGSIVLDGVTYGAWPFESVDCTVDCSADPADGWWELHMLLVDEATAERCFGIVYLLVSYPDLADFQYGFCLSSLRPLARATLPATWTAPGGGGGSRLPAGPRHPVDGYVLRPSPRF